MERLTEEDESWIRVERNEETWSPTPDLHPVAQVWATGNRNLGGNCGMWQDSQLHVSRGNTKQAERLLCTGDGPPEQKTSLFVSLQEVT